MIHQIRKFWDDDSGPELVEWAVVTIILLVAAVVLYVAVGKALGSVICAVKCWLTAITGSHEEINDSTMCDDQENDCQND
jgi:Flp pilus assembly pilin Flp